MRPTSAPRIFSTQVAAPRNAPSSTKLQEQKDQDEAEKEILGGTRLKRSLSSADPGIEKFMTSAAPKITWGLLILIVVLSVFIASHAEI